MSDSPSSSSVPSEFNDEPLIHKATDMEAAAAPSTADADTPTSSDEVRIFSKEDKGRYALFVLTFINLFNYIDRYCPSATKDMIKKDLHLTDTQTSIPLTAFVFVYMLTSPFFSYLSDIGFKRNRIICGGVVIWSIATAAGALAIDFWTFLVSRSLVGVGEAAYATIAPALLSDFYIPKQRSKVLSVFYLAIPVGAALGYGIGGQVGSAFGWRVAFLVCGLPGLVLAFLCLKIKEPKVGATDNVDTAQTTEKEEATAATDTETDTDMDTAAQSETDALGAEYLEDPVTQAHHTELGGPAVAHPRTHIHHTPTQQQQQQQQQQETDHAQAQSDHTSTIAVATVVASAVSINGGESSQSHALEVASADAPVAEAAAAAAEETTHVPPPPWKESIRFLLGNSAYLFGTFGYTLVTFASGGMADWIPTWLHRVHDMSEDTSATVVGGITAIGGIAGTALGAYLGEKAKAHTKNPYLGAPALALTITVITCWFAMVLSNVYVICTLIFVAQVFLWCYTGPINSLTVNSVPASLRVRAFSFQILISHSLGDAISPTIIGAVSDAAGLRNAVLIVPAAFTVGWLIWLVGWRTVSGYNPDGFRVQQPLLEEASGVEKGQQDEAEDEQQLTPSASASTSVAIDVSQLDAEDAVGSGSHGQTGASEQLSSLKVRLLSAEVTPAPTESVARAATVAAAHPHPHPHPHTQAPAAALAQAQAQTQALSPSSPSSSEDNSRVGSVADDEHAVKLQKLDSNGQSHRGAGSQGQNKRKKKK